MDAITQIQSYLRALSALLCSNLEHLYYQSQPMPPNSTIDDIPSAELQERADQMFKLLSEVDLLLSALPENFTSEDEQLDRLEQLSEQNQSAGERLLRAKELSKTWQRRVSKVLAKLADEEFESHNLLSDPSLED